MPLRASCRIPIAISSFERRERHRAGIVIGWKKAAVLALSRSTTTWSGLCVEKPGASTGRDDLPTAFVVMREEAKGSRNTRRVLKESLFSPAHPVAPGSGR